MNVNIVQRPDEQKLFTPFQIAQAFGTYHTRIQTIIKLLKIEPAQQITNPQRTINYYSYSDFIKVKNYMKSGDEKEKRAKEYQLIKSIREAESVTDASAHPLVTDKRFLVTSFFPDVELEPIED